MEKLKKFISEALKASIPDDLKNVTGINNILSLFFQIYEKYAKPHSETIGNYSRSPKWVGYPLHFEEAKVQGWLILRNEERNGKNISFCLELYFRPEPPYSNANHPADMRIFIDDDGKRIKTGLTIKDKEKYSLLEHNVASDYERIANELTFMALLTKSFSDVIEQMKMHLIKVNQ